jgi:hypothetical protein
LKRGSIIIVTGCLVALAMGLALAFPLLAMNLPTTRKESLIVDAVYAYFEIPSLDQKISGLWRNYSIPQEIVDIGGTHFGLDVSVVPYFIVLNVTNNSTAPIYVTNFDLTVGPSIFVGPNGIVSVPHLIIGDYRHVDYLPGWDNIWSANASRLIYLSGIQGVHDIAYKSLDIGNLEILASVEGHVISEDNVAAFGKDYKQIQLQTLDQARLYNRLVGENQTLIFYHEMDVSVGTRLPP